jgi:hypothetical protein
LLNFGLIGRRRSDPLAALIRQLFSAGEQGAFYIPRPIVNGAQALFQDAAGTVAVTAGGDPVGKMMDQSPNSNNASQSVSADRPVYELGSVRESLAFNGNNSGLDAGVPKSIFEESFSASFWLYFNDDSRGTILSNLDDSRGYGLEKHTSGRLRIWYNDSPDVNTSSGVVPINEWVHCVFIRDVASNNFRIYVNKALIRTYTGVGTYTGAGSDTPLLGRDIRTGATVLDGNIGNTVIVNKVLSQSEIDNLYDYG